MQRFQLAIGITAGYHRLYSHRAYSASLPIQLLLLLAGASAVQGSALWWCRSHRSHHRYTDTPLDPYNSHRGLLYTHVGWMVLKPVPSQSDDGAMEEKRGARSDGKPGRANDTDLRKDALVMWQHMNYFPVALFMGYLLPCLAAGWGWGDWRGGWYFAGMIRLTMVHHVGRIAIFACFMSLMAVRFGVHVLRQLSRALSWNDPIRRQAHASRSHHHSYLDAW
jgi:stearoyl-CoA desaturase (Delta-9 desaturase)